MRRRQRKSARRMRRHHRKQFNFFAAFKRYLAGFAF